MTTFLQLTDASADTLRQVVKEVLLDILHTDREFVRQLVDELREELDSSEAISQLVHDEPSTKELLPRPGSNKPFDKYSIVGIISAEPDFAERSEDILHGIWKGERDESHDAY